MQPKSIIIQKLRQVKYLSDNFLKVPNKFFNPGTINEYYDSPWDIDDQTVSLNGSTPMDLPMRIYTRDPRTGFVKQQLIVEYDPTYDTDNFGGSDIWLLMQRQGKEIDRTPGIVPEQRISEAEKDNQSGYTILNIGIAPQPYPEKLETSSAMDLLALTMG